MKVKSIIKRIYSKLQGKVQRIQEVNNVFNGAVAINPSLIKVGERVSFGGQVILNANAFIDIGDDTMIAYNSILTTSTHDYMEHPMWIKRIDSPIKIGRHVWIGINSVILPGVIIEDFAVVAAGSIVVDNVPQGAIVAGNPARIIKYRDRSIYNDKNNNEIEYPGKNVEGMFRQKYCKCK